MRHRPFLFRLPRREMTNNRVFGREDLPGGGGKRRVGMDFSLKRRRWWNLPAGQKLCQPSGFMLRFHCRRHPLVVAKFPAEESATFVPAQSPPRPDEPAQNGATIVAGKIHQTIETLAAQRAKDGPALTELRLTTPTRHRPDSMKIRKPLEQRGNFRRHQQMQFAVGKVAVQGAKCRREQDGVTKVFELESENLQSAKRIK